MAFKKVRHSHLYDQKNARWDVEIWQDSYTGSSVEFDMQGEGFEITWNGEGDTRNVVFLASELTLNYFVQNQTDEDFMYNDILVDGQKKHYIRVYKTPNGGTKEIWWYGWVAANFSNLENAPFPYVTQITATDSYGAFKTRSKDTFTNHTDKTTHHKITEIVGRQDDPDSGSNHRGFLGRMNLMPSTDGTSNLTPCPHRKDGNESSGTNFSVIIKNMIEWVRRNADASINDYNITYVQGGNTPLRDPFFNYYFSKSQFSKADNFDENDELIPPTGDALKYKESDVFDACLKIFGAIGVLSEGSYRFFQPHNYKYSICEDPGEVPFYAYRTSTQMSEAITGREQQANTNDLLTIDQTNHVVLGGSNLTYEPALKDVSLSFDEGFTVTNVEQGVALDTSIGIGPLSNVDHGPIKIDFFAIAKEIVNEPAVSTSSSVPRYTNSAYKINNYSIKTNTRLKIKQLQPDGTFKYLQQLTGSDTLTWTDSDTTINILRGDIDYSGGDESDPINNPNIMAVGPINSGNYSHAGNTLTIIQSDTQGVNNDKRLTTTQIKFTAFIEKPTNTGNIFIEAPSRNLTTGSFVGHYKQIQSDGTPNSQYSGPFEFGTIGGADNNPTFVSSETISQELSIYYTDLDEGETVSSKVTYTSSQNSTPSNTSFDLGTTLIGQTPINPQASICFRNATASNIGGLPATYPSYNQTDEFEIKPCETGFKRTNVCNSSSIKNISKLVTDEFLDLQSEPLEILQADIFSADISPSKLIKYRIGGSSGSFKFYLFKGGTFKAQSATMSGEWYKVSELEPTITNTFDPNIPPNPFPEPHGFGGFGGITPGGGVIDTIITGTQISVNTNTNNIINNLNLNIIGKVGTALAAGTSYDRIILAANVVGKYYSGQKLFLAFPNGSNQLEVTCDNTATTGAFVDVATITPTTNYPVGSIVLVKTADLTNVITGGGGGSTPTLAQVTGDRMTVEGSAGTTGGTSVVGSGSVHTITEGAAWIHTQDIGDKSGNNSLNLRLYSGQGEGTDFDRSESSIPNDSTARQTGLVVVQSGDLKNIGSGNSTTGEIALSSGSSIIGSGVAQSGNVIISSGSATSAGNTTSGNITITSGTSATSAGNTTSGNITITPGASISGSTYMIPGFLSLGNIRGHTKIKGYVTQIGESTPSTGKVLQWDGLKAVWAASVGGSSTQVQYNQGGVIKGEAGFVYDEGNDRLTVPKVNTPILQSIAGDGTVSHQIYTVSQNMAILTNTGVDVYLNAGNASAGSKAFSIKSAVTGNIVFAVTDTGVIKAIGNKIQDSAGTDVIDMSTAGTTIIEGNTQLNRNAPATLSGPDADKLILSSIDDLEFKIASGGASSKSFKFINNTTEVGSINSSGDLQIDGGLTTGGGTITIGGSNSNLELDAGSDIILEADQNGGGLDSTIQYPDSGGTNRIMLGVDNNVVILSNRAANGTVQIRANSSTAGGSGETTSAIFKDDAIVLIKEAEFSAGISDSGTIAAGTWNGTAIAQAKIADQAINEAKLQVSNAPVNGYVLTAQSGNTGGLTWAEQASGGGSSSSIITQIFTIAYHSNSTSSFYITMSGALTNESTSLSTASYHLILPCPFDGTIKRITSHHSNSVSNGTSKFELYIDGDDDDLVGDQRGSDLTVTNGYNAGTAAKVFTADCPADWTFSKNETLAIRRTDSSGRGGATVSFVIEFDTST